MTECWMFQIAAASQMPSWLPDLLCPSDPEGAERVRGNLEEGKNPRGREKSKAASRHWTGEARKAPELSPQPAPLNYSQLVPTGLQRLQICSQGT